MLEGAPECPRRSISEIISFPGKSRPPFRPSKHEVPRHSACVSRGPMGPGHIQLDSSPEWLIVRAFVCSRFRMSVLF